MLVGAFLMSSLSLDSSNYGSQALLIGLGGGAVNMALSSYKPEVNITAVEIDELIVAAASKWFGVKESDNHHVVVGDGLVFLQNAVSKGLKYDVVFLDACKNGALVCPAKAFRTFYALEMMKEVLVKTGALVINIATLEDANTDCAKLKKRLVSTFKTCLEIQSCISRNVIFICTPSVVPNFKRQIPVLNKRMKELERSLDIIHFLGESRVVPPTLTCSFSDFQLHGIRE